jgi:hypothetical protein
VSNRHRVLSAIHKASPGHNQSVEPPWLRVHFLVIYNKCFVRVVQLLHGESISFFVISSPQAGGDWPAILDEEKGDKVVQMLTIPARAINHDLGLIPRRATA